MTSVLKPNEIISEFVTTHTKRLILFTRAKKTVCKVRGITLNGSASQLVNFERIKYMILKGTEQDTVTVHTERKIKRKRGKDGDGRVIITSEPEDKNYRILFFKRIRLSDNSSFHWAI